MASVYLSLFRERSALITFLFHSLFRDEREMSQELIDPLQRTTTRQFRQLIEYYLHHGYRFISPRDLERELPAEGKYVLLTFDDGYYNNTLALPILEMYDVPALFFIATEPAWAGLTQISNSPLASSTSAQVKPNIMFILDTSGSMAWDFMPDSISNRTGTVGYKNSSCNYMYYNPNVTYTVPKKSDGSNFPTASFTAAQAAAKRFAMAGEKAYALQRSNPEHAAALNAALRNAETALLLPNGLPHRPWFKHAIADPGEYTGYAAVVIPGVTEGIEAKDNDRTQQQLNALATALNNAAGVLESATK